MIFLLLVLACGLLSFHLLCWLAFIPFVGEAMVKPKVELPISMAVPVLIFHDLWGRFFGSVVQNAVISVVFLLSVYHASSQTVCSAVCSKRMG